MNNGSFLKRAIVAGAACLALSGAPATQAGTLIINSILGENVNLIGAISGGTTAGTFSGTFNGNALNFWCIDLAKHVSVPGGPYEYTLASFDTGPLFSSTQDAQIATLFAQAFSAATLTDAHAAAVFQIAIWDILFDDSFHDVTTGGAGFGVSPVADLTLLSDAQALINNAIAGPAAQSSLTQLTSRSNQNFIANGPPNLIPEPSALALLGAGLAAMTFAMRRRKVGGQVV